MATGELIGRFAVANVPDEVIVQLGPRLLLLNELLGSGTWQIGDGKA